MNHIQVQPFAWELKASELFQNDGLARLESHHCPVSLRLPVLLRAGLHTAAWTAASGVPCRSVHSAPASESTLDPACGDSPFCGDGFHFPDSLLF